MELTLYMSHLCPHCINAIKMLEDAGVHFKKKDITSDLGYLKEFLELREDPSYRKTLFRTVVAEGKIGVPCFVFSDGTKYLLPEEALKKLGK